jgi:hypothetical protein
MHRTPGSRLWFNRPSVPLISVLGGSLVLISAGCTSDAPTAVGVGGTTTAVPSFVIAPGAAHAALTATNRLVRTLPTLQATHAGAAKVAAAGANTGSPFDLTNSGGPVLTQATSYALYVNCASTASACWGTGAMTPATFLNDLNVSSLLQVANQYLGENAPGNFNVTEVQTTAAFPTDTASINDIFSIIFSASNFESASGYNAIFHVFLPQGMDMCITPTECYSPDNPSTFTFCAFHGSVDFGPNQHVIYSVEPYQGVNGCRTPNQVRLIDATASTLTHEFFEAITDPDLDAWFNWLTGNEIADLCIGLRNNEHIGHNTYIVQEMYSNSAHACSDRAS